MNRVKYWKSICKFSNKCLYTCNYIGKRLAQLNESVAVISDKVMNLPNRNNINRNNNNNYDITARALNGTKYWETNQVLIKFLDIQSKNIVTKKRIDKSTATMSQSPKPVRNEKIKEMSNEPEARGELSKYGTKSANIKTEDIKCSVKTKDHKEKNKESKDTSSHDRKDNGRPSSANEVTAMEGELKVHSKYIVKVGRGIWILVTFSEILKFS